MWVWETMNSSSNLLTSAAAGASHRAAEVIARGCGGVSHHLLVPASWIDTCESANNQKNGCI